MTRISIFYLRIKFFIKSLPVISGIFRTVYNLFRKKPMGVLIKKIQHKEPGLSPWRALDAFAFKGEWMTNQYSPYCATLDLWEINEECRESLHRNFPNATVNITDSFQQIKTEKKRYNLIVMDNPFQDYGEKGEYSEHFDMFPGVFRIAEDSAVLIMNVIPYANKGMMQLFPKLFRPDHLARRASFYRTKHPENLSFEEMVSAYSEYAKQNGFNLNWYLTENRYQSFYLLAFKITKIEARSL